VKNEIEKVVVVGLGEVGKPLFELVSKHYRTIGVDITPPKEPIQEGVDVMHVCYPFQIKDFIGETTRYIRLFQPKITIINSTVQVGTTRAVAERTKTAVVNSPVRGKHAHMLEDLQVYVKFVGGMQPEASETAAKHFQSLGLMTRILGSPEASELAKLTETTYFGLMIAWAQEVERYCDRFGADYDEVVSIYEEIKFFPPVKYTPGVIGGHCVMPNIEILNRAHESELLNAIRSSNLKKTEREERRRGERSRNRARRTREVITSRTGSEGSGATPAA
jgi:UDP-N-acetyl-D-mannosaminuronate dehydrogenase